MDGSSIVCGYCSSCYHDPRILSCLHSYCLECITKIQESGASPRSITCPSCSHPTFLPDEKGVISLPINVRLKEEVERDNLIQRLVSSPPPRCDSCEETNSSSVAYCKDCTDTLCSECLNNHKKMKALRTHTVLVLDDLKKKSRSDVLKLVLPPPNNLRSLPMCLDHEDQQLGFYCCTKCNVPVCSQCTIDKHSQEAGHIVQGLGEYVSQSKANIIQAIEGLPESVKQLEQLMISFEAMKAKIKRRKDEVNGIVRDAFAKLRQVVDQREEALLAKNSLIAMEKEATITMHVDTFQRLLESIVHCHSVSSVATTDYSDVQYLSIAHVLRSRAFSLRQQFSSTPFGGCEMPDTSVSVYTDALTDVIAEFGDVTDPSPISDINLTIMSHQQQLDIGSSSSTTVPHQQLGIGLTTVPQQQQLGIASNSSAKVPRQQLGIGDNSSASVVIVPRKQLGVGMEMPVKVICKGEEIEEGRVIKAEVKSWPGSNERSFLLSTADNGDSSHTFSIVPEQLAIGRYQLCVTVNNQPVQGSPFGPLSILPKRDYTKLRDPVETISNVRGPVYIAFSDNGDVFVTSDTHCVLVYDKNGKKKATIGSKGSGEVQFLSPSGIDVKGEVLYVAEYQGHRIHVLTTAGEFIGTFGEYGDDVGQFDSPCVIRISPDGKMFVADYGNGRIQVFNSDWSICHIIDASVGVALEFIPPNSICLDFSGNLHVSGTSNYNLVNVFTPNGQFVRYYGDEEVSVMAVDIAIDPSGFSLVACHDSNSLKIFDAEGAFVHSVTVLGIYGVSVAADGSVLIASRHCHGNSSCGNQLLKY